MKYIIYLLIIPFTIPALSTAAGNKNNMVVQNSWKEVTADLIAESKKEVKSCHAFAEAFLKSGDKKTAQLWAVTAANKKRQCFTDLEDLIRIRLACQKLTLEQEQLCQLQNTARTNPKQALTLLQAMKRELNNCDC